MNPGPTDYEIFSLPCRAWHKTPLTCGNRFTTYYWGIQRVTRLGPNWAPKGPRRRSSGPNIQRRSTLVCAHQTRKSRSALWLERLRRCWSGGLCCGLLTSCTGVLPSEETIVRDAVVQQRSSPDSGLERLDAGAPTHQLGRTVRADLLGCGQVAVGVREEDLGLRMTRARPLQSHE